MSDPITNKAPEFSESVPSSIPPPPLVSETSPAEVVPMAENAPPGEQTMPFLSPSHRKLLVRALFVCAFVAIALIGGQIYVNIYRHDSLKLLPAKPEEDPDALAKAKDTDSDGISNYDEEKIYFTSPYLADSDSDGVSDRDEIMAGNNPNCPTGKVCNTSEVRTNLTTEDLGMGAPTPPAIDPAVAELADPSKVTPERIRELLGKGGLSKEAVSQFSDDDLHLIYTDALSKVENETQKKTTATPKTSDDSAKTAVVSLPDNPNAKDVRVFLANQGADPKLLEGLSDEQIMAAYQATLDKVKNKKVEPSSSLGTSSAENN